jgi:hypothetical protein
VQPDTLLAILAVPTVAVVGILLVSAFARAILTSIFKYPSQTSWLVKRSGTWIDLHEVQRRSPKWPGAERK